MSDKIIRIWLEHTNASGKLPHAELVATGHIFKDPDFQYDRVCLEYQDKKRKFKHFVRLKPDVLGRGSVAPNALQETKNIIQAFKYFQDLVGNIFPFPLNFPE